MSDDPVTLIHPDLPGREYQTNPLHAQVLAQSGWIPKPAEAAKPATKHAEGELTDAS